VLARPTWGHSLRENRLQLRLGRVHAEPQLIRGLFEALPAIRVEARLASGEVSPKTAATPSRRGTISLSWPQPSIVELRFEQLGVRTCGCGVSNDTRAKLPRKAGSVRHSPQHSARRKSADLLRRCHRRCREGESRHSGARIRPRPRIA
jgi:hypothetical protein